MSALDQAPGDDARETASRVEPFEVPAITSLDRLSSSPVRTYPAVPRGGRGFSVTLPLPVSANRMYRRGREGKSTHISKEYAEWKRDAAHAVQSLNLEPVVGRYLLTILIPAKDRADADNRVKAVSDLLSRVCCVIPDDKHAWQVTVRRDEAIHARLCRVIVSTPDDAMSRGAAAGGALGGKHPPARCVDGPV